MIFHIPILRNIKKPLSYHSHSFRPLDFRTATGKSEAEFHSWGDMPRDGTACGEMMRLNLELIRTRSN